ncbi:MAG: RNA 2',3'-cyclic phosphodiesterase [Dehalococcoidia bacterium]
MPESVDGPPLRLFVAIELPEPVLAALGDVQDQLRAHRLEGLRWTRPEGVHLTLKFLGETPAVRLGDIEAAVASAVDGRTAFRLALGAAGTFGSRGRPRVVWIDLEGEVEELRRLQLAVEAALVAIGFPAEEREFSPHLTLARVRQPPPRELAERLTAALAEVSTPEMEFEAKEVSLMRSELGPGGAVYTRLAAFPLTEAR